MGQGPRIAIDAMGGDSGPEVIVAGAALAWQRRDDLHFLLFGHEDAIQAELAKHGGLEAVSTIIHCDDVISTSRARRSGAPSPVRWAAPSRR